MHIILNITDPKSGGGSGQGTGNGLGNTGVSITMWLLILALIILGISLIHTYLKLNAKKMAQVSKVLVIIPILAMLISSFVSINPSNAAIITPEHDETNPIVINVKKSVADTKKGNKSLKTFSKNTSVELSDLLPRTGSYKLQAKLRLEQNDQHIGQGIKTSLKKIELKTTSKQILEDEISNTNQKLPVQIKIPANIKAGTYEYDVDFEVQEVAKTYNVTHSAAAVDEYFRTDFGVEPENDIVNNFEQDDVFNVKANNTFDSLIPSYSNILSNTEYGEAFGATAPASWTNGKLFDFVKWCVDSPVFDTASTPCTSAAAGSSMTVGTSSILLTANYKFNVPNFKEATSTDDIGIHYPEAGGDLNNGWIDSVGYEFEYYFSSSSSYDCDEATTSTHWILTDGEIEDIPSAGGTYCIRYSAVDGIAASDPQTIRIPQVTPRASLLEFGDRLSFDNVNYADEVGNFYGGDLIIKQVLTTESLTDSAGLPIGTTAFDPSSSNNIITIGGVLCNTTGQGYVANGGTITVDATGAIGTGAESKPTIGCVIPERGETYNMATGQLTGFSRSLVAGRNYDVQVSVNGAAFEKVGSLHYRRHAFDGPSPLKWDECVTFQRFAAYSYSADTGLTPTISDKCKGIMRQGIAIVLEDERGGADVGVGRNYYRVKKMSDGNVWMLDNLALDLPDGSTSGGDDGLTWGTAPLRHTGSERSVNTFAQWTTEGYQYSKNFGFLYNFCAAIADVSTGCSVTRTLTDGNMPNSLSATGWNLPTGNTGGEFESLDTAMFSESKYNPVYSTTGKINWHNTTALTYGSDALAPWQGVTSGFNDSGVYNLTTSAGYWSSTTTASTSPQLAYFFLYHIGKTDTYYLTNLNNAYKGYALRSVL